MIKATIAQTPVAKNIDLFFPSNLLILKKDASKSGKQYVVMVTSRHGDQSFNFTGTVVATGDNETCHLGQHCNRFERDCFEQFVGKLMIESDGQK